MTDIAWPLIACIADGRSISEAEAAAIVDALRVPAPAVPDDVAEIVETLRKATFTKGRTRGGIGGQTIEAHMRRTFHEVSAWDLDQAADALEAQAAELARLTSALQRIADGNVDWFHKPADEMQDIASAALTQPTGDRT